MTAPCGLCLVDELPAPAHYERLRAAVGWGTHPPDVTAAALPRSLYGVCAYRSGELIGMARVIGDGGLAYYIQDVIVLPEHQGQGIGAALMDRVMAWIAANARPGAVIGLMAAVGREAFYARYGFTRRPNGQLGAGMTRFWQAPTVAASGIAVAEEEVVPWALPMAEGCNPASSPAQFAQGARPMTTNTTPHLALARSLAARFAALPQVVAVAVGGSLAAGSATAAAVDAGSDLDLYVFTREAVPLPARQALVAAFGASRADLGLAFWDPGDEWIHADTGIEVDVVYWDTRWIADQVARVLVRHEASVGYSTCFWRTVRDALPLADADGWLARLQASARCPYPEALVPAIVAQNHPLLRGVIPAYRAQIGKALRRGDLVSVNHRVAALLASYFDVLFALNRVAHPGEKRLVAKARAECALLPEGFEESVTAMLAASASGDEGLLARLDALADGLDALLRVQGYDPATSRLM
jgi:GNAT superfamily N-acetyltransferase